MSKMKKQSFLQGAFVLICASVIVKVIGAGFKIPLAHLIKEEGMGLFSAAYTVYTILFVIATAGFPIAISKMVSECVAVGKQREADRVFNVSMIMLLFVGVIGSLIIYLGADLFAAFLKVDNVVPVIKAIAPAVFFVAVMSALRGYFQGHQNMLPTAYSEVAEAIGKLVIGYILSYQFMKLSVTKAAAGAIMGVTAGTVFGALTLVIIYLFQHNKTRSYDLTEAVRSKRSIAKELVKIAVPITIGASVSSITTLVDMATITRRLQSITQVTQEFAVKYSSLLVDMNFDGSIGEELATKLYGLYSGYAIPLFNLPLTIVAAIAMSVVPAIAAAIATRDKAHSETVTKSALRITILLAVPCGVGLFVLAKPVLLLLYNNGLAFSLLEKLGPAIVFVSLVSVTAAVLQAYGKPSIPMINLVIGGVVKILTNYILVGNPKFNIDGAPIGTMICYFVIVLLNTLWVIKVTGYKFRLSEFVVKPIITAGIMGVAVKIFFDLCFKLGLGNAVAVIISVGIGVIVYGLLILVTGTIKRDDILMLPKGEGLIKILTKTKLIK